MYAIEKQNETELIFMKKEKTKPVKGKPSPAPDEDDEEFFVSVIEEEEEL